MSKLPSGSEIPKPSLTLSQCRLQQSEKASWQKWPQLGGRLWRGKKVGREGISGVGMDRPGAVSRGPRKDCLAVLRTSPGIGTFHSPDAVTVPHQYFSLSSQAPSPSAFWSSSAASVNERKNRCLPAGGRARDFWKPSSQALHLQIGGGHACPLSPPLPSRSV